MSFGSNIIGLSATAAVLLIPPLAWHSQSKNIAAVILIIWLFIMDITFLISAAIWSGEEFAMRWSGKGWCDIVTKLQMGANVGIACAVTTIVSNLHVIIRADSVIPDVNSWKKIGRDLAMCLITPFLVMGLSYLVQFSRFGIARYYGCTNLLSPTWVTTVLYTMWALIWSTVATTYAILVLIIFYRKRKDVRDILHCTNSKLNLTRFSRLLVFCFLIVLVIFPLAIYAVVEDIRNLNGPYSFSQTHNEYFWNTIPKFDEGKTMFSVWLYILMSLMVFFIFGLGNDALNLYSDFLKKIGLGFVLDSIEKSIQSKKKNRISAILRKLSPTADPRELSCSESSLEKGYESASTFISSSSGSRAHFYVDYRTPYDTKQGTNITVKPLLNSILRKESDNVLSVKDRFMDNTNAPLSTIIRTTETHDSNSTHSDKSFPECFGGNKSLNQ